VSQPVAAFASCAPIWQDVLAQAITGERLAAMNYASLSEICDDPEEAADALEHARIEQVHAARFAAEGHKIGLDLTSKTFSEAWDRSLAD
jgi:rubrerythrin